MRSQIRLPNPSAPLDVVMEAILRHMTAQEAANYEGLMPFSVNSTETRIQSSTLLNSTVPFESAQEETYQAMMP